MSGIARPTALHWFASHRRSGSTRQHHTQMRSPPHVYHTILTRDVGHSPTYASHIARGESMRSVARSGLQPCSKRRPAITIPKTGACRCSACSNASNGDIAHQPLDASPSQSRILILRAMGWIALGPSFATCILDSRWAKGTVPWLGQLTIVALAYVGRLVAVRTKISAAAAALHN